MATKQKINKTQAGAGLPEDPPESHVPGDCRRPDQARIKHHAEPCCHHQEQGSGKAKCQEGGGTADRWCFGKPDDRSSRDADKVQ